MFRKMIWLISLASLLTLTASVQAGRLVNNFDTAQVLTPDNANLMGTFDVVDVNTTRPGALYMQTTGASWDPGPGPMVYETVTGDFIATVKVVDFAGTLDAVVFHNDAGIVARDPAGAPGAENWVSMNYFPTWTGFVARNTVNSNRGELGQTAGRWTGADTYAIAAQYPYIQLERKGDDFFFRVSADGENFLPLTDPAYLGISDGTQTPLVVNRPDLPDTLQVGLLNATYDVTTGYVAFDDFSIVTPNPKVVWVSFHGADDAPTAKAAAVGWTEATDKAYTDLLTANGYDVTRYISTATPDVNLLNAADLVIIGRAVPSGNYQNNAATIWNSQITAPMIITGGYVLRNSRMGFTAGGDMPDITGDIKLTVSDPNHPIFAGIPITDGIMDNPYAGMAVYPLDPNVPTRGISINNNPANQYGTVLATIAAPADPNDPNDPNDTFDPITGPAGGLVIAEWPARVKLTHSGGAGTDILAGPRLVFLTGSREPSGVTGGEASGIYDLYDDGTQMFLNAVAYMLTPKTVVVPVVNPSFEQPGTVKIQGWNGEGSAGTPAVDIPGWASDTVAADSGVETGWTPTDGLWTGFVKGSDPTVWQTTDFIIQENDVFVLKVDMRNTWLGTAAKIILYCDLGGVRVPVASQEVTLTEAMQTFTLEFAAADAPVAVDLPIGIEFDNIAATGDSWIGLDNVRLTLK